MEIKRVMLILALSMCCIKSSAIGDTLTQKSTDTLGFWSVPETVQKKRLIPVVTGASLLYIGTMYSFNKAWYSEYEKAPFHFYNDWGSWNHMDKLGHIYGGYFQSVIMMDMFRWTGLPKKTSVALGGLCGMAYQTIIETLDGYSSAWGWSWGDMGANFVGAGSAMAQELAWDEQRIQIKFSAHRVKYTGDFLARADTLYGRKTPNRILKDYNGQTYWLTVNPWTFNKTSRWPKWLGVSVGIGAEGLFGGYNNTWVDDAGYIQSLDAPRYTQIYLSPDIDLTRIPTRRKGLQFAFYLLNIIKVPLPTLEFNSQQGVRFHAFYF